MNPATTEGSKTRKVGESLLAFYPLILVVVCTPLIFKFDVLWVGIVLGVILLALKNTWWTCIFGLLNGMVIVAMMLACGGAWVVSSKNEADKTSILTPDPQRVCLGMNIQPSTQKSEGAFGLV